MGLQFCHETLVFLWDFRGISVRIQYFHGILMERPEGFQRDSHGTSVGPSRGFHDAPMGRMFPWDRHGTCLDFQATLQSLFAWNADGFPIVSSMGHKGFHGSQVILSGDFHGTPVGLSRSFHWTPIGTRWDSSGHMGL